MTFNEAALLPASIKNILFEIDIGITIDWWKNADYPYVYKINFDATYPEITDPALLTGHPDYEITTIASVREDGQLLNKLSSQVALSTSPGSFFYDATFRTLYVHCTDSNEPQLHNMLGGNVYGFSNNPLVLNNIVYEPRIQNVSSIRQSKDPLFFGRITFDSFTVDVINNDGLYDIFGEQNSIFGNGARLLIGFDDIAYSEYKQIASGVLATTEVTQDIISFNIEDLRKRLSQSIVPNRFQIGTYPSLNDGDINSVIPLGYGTIKGAKPICTNQEAVTPTNYNFKICDTTYHSIYAIDSVLVEGVAVTPASTNLTDATFVITAASGDYNPGDQVTVNFRGYTDALGYLISDGLDVLKDILINYAQLPYNNDIFDTGQWNVASLDDFAVGYYVNSETKVFEAIEEISKSMRTDIFIKQDGRLTAKKFNRNTALVRQIQVEEIIGEPNAIKYDPTEIVTSTVIKYGKNYSDDDMTMKYVDSAIYLYTINGVENREEFDTLLVNSADAQLFSDNVFDRSGSVQKLTSIKTKTRNIMAEIVENYSIPILARASGSNFQNAKAELIGRTIDINDFSVTLDFRIFEIESEMLPQSINLWDAGTVWGDDGMWSNSDNVEV